MSKEKKPEKEKSREEWMRDTEKTQKYLERRKKY
jgi:hypothetical protein